MARESKITWREPILSALPGTPTDGQIINYLADATAGVVWRLRYRSASASTYKWEFLGGPSLRAEVATQETIPSGTYGDIATVGPSVTVPLAGDYDIHHGARIGGPAFGEQSISVGGGTAIDAEGARVSVAATNEFNVARQVRRAGITAASIIRAKYRSSSTSEYAAERWLVVTPVRVG
jgi:hypothetical protein